MKLWLATIKSESGDNYGSFAFKEKPSDEKLKKWLIETFPGDADNECMGLPEGYKGPGIFGTYLHISWQKGLELIEL